MAEQGSGFFAGFVIGSIVGAGLALIFAPRPGEETRKQLLEKTIELQGKAEGVTTLARTVADELLDTGKTVIDEQRARVQKAWEEGKEAAAQTAAEMMEKLDRPQRETGPGA
ncbi:MAG: YtxH domain-containing protein [Chloroflexi bacterium]|nr:YtxH domain-containing protein [Chloroflexota bacterium]